MTMLEWVEVAGVVYAVMSMVTMIAYAVDKAAAKRGRGRTPENVLHVLELLGGWPGAWVAQRWIRHKNAKLPYQVVFWMIVVVHVAGWVVALRMWS